MDTSLSQKKKRESLGKKAKGTKYFEDSEDNMRRKDKSKLNQRFQIDQWFNSLVTCVVLGQVKTATYGLINANLNSFRPMQIKLHVSLIYFAHFIS